MTEEAPKTVRAAVGMGAITAASRAFGFVRVLVIAAVLGSTYLGNAFQSANSLSNVVFELVAAGALSSVLVPIFVDLLASSTKEEAEAVAGGVLGVAIAALGTLAALGMVASPLLARLLTLGVPPEFADDERRLVGFLLLFFLPQIAMYAAGTVATGVLHAKRRFMAVAAAPIANTLVMVAFLFAFRAVAGTEATLDLTTGERLLLAAAGTGGVVAFIAVLVAACRSTGFRLRPRLRDRHPGVGPALRRAGWGVVLHSSAGVLLGGAIIAGAAVEGGVVAYQTAWVFFLAPYAIFSQPIHTAILPELVPEAREAGLDRYSRSVRWAVERIGLSIVPVSALMIAVAGPAMRAVLVSRATEGAGPELYSAALAALALGLFPYGCFLMLARAFYALDDSRTPGLAALGVAAVGATIMAVGSPFTHGTARIVLIGVAHTTAHAFGALVLGVLLRRRTHHRILPRSVFAIAAASAVAGVAAWVVGDAVVGAQPTRTSYVLACLAGALVGAAILAGAARLGGLRRHLVERTASPVAPLASDAVGGVA